ncbi:hypothetical protein [Roseomonas chloroacetimidivorans]|uniref:hypothetical protein n=1 Tax=Roseomonas chloroacetimidivorans TaxID=1766656 RepID=UPI003C78FDC4
MTLPPPLPPEEERSAMALIVDGEELIAKWAKLNPGQRRVLLALVRTMTDGKQE